MAIHAMSPLVRLIEAYLTPEGDLALQGRYYQGLCLLTAILVTFVIVPGNLVLGLPWVINLAAMGVCDGGLRPVHRRRDGATTTPSRSFSRCSPHWMRHGSPMPATTAASGCSSFRR